LFAIAIFPLLEELQRQLPDGFVQAYIDDITQLAPFHSQCRALQSLPTCSTVWPLPQLPQKFKILLDRCDSKELADERRHVYQQLCPGILPANIVTHPEDDQSFPDHAYGLEILGTPVGSAAYVQNHFHQYMATTLRQELSRLDQVSNLQTLWCYIHYVVNSKITHLLRTIPPAYTTELVQDFMRLQMQLTQRVFDIPALLLGEGVDDLQAAFHDVMCQSQLKLPTCIAAGGMGLRHYEDISQAAFLASVVCCRHH
jgi:hypothetical protein